MYITCGCYVDTLQGASQVNHTHQLGTCQHINVSLRASVERMLHIKINHFRD